MKILHIGKRYPPERGGMEAVVETLCLGMAPEHDVTALVSHAGRKTVEEMRDAVRVVRLGVSLRMLSQDVTLHMPRHIRRLAGDVNVVHLPNPWAVISALRSRAPGRWVAFYHTDITRHRLSLALYRPLLRRFLKKADCIVATSPPYIQSSNALPDFKDKCAMIPLGVDTGRYDPARRDEAAVAAIREQYGDHALFVGRAIYYKGLDVLVSAWRKVDHPVLIVGQGPLLPRIKALAREHGVLKRMHFLGELSGEKLLSHFHACSLLVLPSTSRGEAFGLVQVEAMACGKPVISTDLPSGVPWVNQHERTGLVVPPGDADALARAAARLLGDAGMLDRLGRAGMERARSEFDAAVMVERHQRLYEELAGAS